MGFLTTTCWNNRVVRVESAAGKTVHKLFVGGLSTVQTKMCTFICSIERQYSCFMSTDDGTHEPRLLALCVINIVMMTSSNGNIFRVTGPLCGEFTGPGEFPTQRPVTRSFDVFFDLRPNKRLSKQPRGWWFETQSWSLWRHCNGNC